MPTPMIARCPKCSNMVARQPNDTTFWCTCGRHWPAPHQTSEIELEEKKTVVELPDIEIAPKKPSRGKIRTTAAYTFENRTLYLHRNKLTEAEIMIDDEGKEYWIKDNFYTGTSEKIYLPARFKNQKKH